MASTSWVTGSDVWLMGAAKEKDHAKEIALSLKKTNTQGCLDIFCVI